MAGAATAVLSVRRQYWWGKDNNNDSEKEKGKSKEKKLGKPDEDVVVKDKSGSNLLTSLGTGDDAPQWPHLIGLPVSRRPLFPGLLQAVSVTDERVVDALMKRRESGHAYLGVFLRYVCAWWTQVSMIVCSQEAGRRGQSAFRNNHERRRDFPHRHFRANPQRCGVSSRY
jgi:hypothetical protein